MWLKELFCPEHGLIVLIPAIFRFWGAWRLGMRMHLSQLRGRLDNEPAWS